MDTFQVAVHYAEAGRAHSFDLWKSQIFTGGDEPSGIDDPFRAAVEARRQLVKASRQTFLKCCGFKRGYRYALSINRIEMAQGVADGKETRGEAPHILV